ncbi:MAG: DedA family protein [Chloroflexi bacterium]|nr:MAG: DedA family protein [Chloroflexota bacterium]
MAIESACIPFPSEIIMPLSGWFLIKERGHGYEFLLLAALFGALGNLIGSLVAYYAGMWGGRPFLERYGRWILITPRELDIADRWFGRYGEIAVFASRLLPVVRTFISLPAGMVVWPCLGRLPPGRELGGHIEVPATGKHTDCYWGGVTDLLLRVPAHP